MVAAAAATALRVRLGGVAAAHAGRDARPPWAEVAENAALEPPSQRVALRSPGWLLCMCSIVVAFHGRASKVCGVVGEAATSRCLGGPEAPLEASPDDACAREPRPGSAETGAAAAPGSASAIIKDSPAFFLFLFQKRVSVKRSYGTCDWGRTHIAVERKHTEWRDHHTKQNVAPKGDPHLSSVPHGCTAHTWHGRSRLTGTPQRWAFDDLSPLHMQALRQGWVSRPVSKGMHAGHKSEMGAGQVSGYVS